MNLELLTFLLYIFIAANTTIFVGQALYKNGAIFLERIFQSLPHIVGPVNKLLLLGFYLVNLGFVLAFFTQKTGLVETAVDCLEFLSGKLGIVYLLLGGMHLFNILVFVAIEKKLEGGKGGKGQMRVDKGSLGTHPLAQSEYAKKACKSGKPFPTLFCPLLPLITKNH